MFAVALHKLGQTGDATRLLDRLAIAFPFERVVRDTSGFLKQQDAELRGRAQRSARAYRWIAGITVVAAAGALMFLRENVKAGSPLVVTTDPSPAANTDAAHLVALALSGAADSLADLQNDLRTKGQLTSELETRLDALRTNVGRRNYAEAQRLLAAGDTIRAAALLESASEAGPENYWVDDALYQLMNILEASGRRLESQRMARKILTEHPQSAFSNSRTLHLSSQNSQ
jgi:tetratricopeptide (TPR) repeat protein